MKRREGENVTFRPANILNRPKFRSSGHQNTLETFRSARVGHWELSLGLRVASDENQSMRYLLTMAVFVPALAVAADGVGVTFNGYTSLEFEKRLGGTGNADPEGSFDADLFDLVINARPVERVRATADFTWEHGPASEDGRGNVALEYGFVEYTVSNSLRIRAGKMFTPYGVFNEIHTAKPVFLSVKEAASTNKPERIVAAERFFPRWSTGIAAVGSTFAGDWSLDYNLMVANGEQDETNPYEQDNNSAKAITGRLRLESDTMRLGVSMYYDDPGEMGITRLSPGGHFFWRRGGFELNAELVAGIFEHPDGPDNTQLGGFIQPAFRAGKWVPYLRLDWVDPNIDVADDEGMSVLVGLNVEIASAFHLKAELERVSGRDNSSLSGGHYQQFRSAIVLGF